MGQTIAIVSDIHSNLEALETVLKHIESKGIKEIICLGDIVGYGPNPAECVEISSKFKLTMMGNHDEGLTSYPVGFTLRAQKALDWTREQLRPNWLSSKIVKEHWIFLKNLPITHQDDDVLYVHASPRQPTTEYILRTDCDEQFGGFAKLDEIFSMIKHICFVGHTHDPGIIQNDKYLFFNPKDISYTYEVKDGIKAIINVGSVGQPRDGDNRACYITFDGKTINYHRVEYDYNKTMGKIFQYPELERYFGERLALGH